MEKKPMNKKPVESQPKASRNPDPIWDAAGFEEFYDNKLSLSAELKAELKEQDLDWRFINIAQFRHAGNRHHSLWRPYNVKSRSPIDAFKGIDPEGVLTRGDLVLAVRPKHVSAAYRKKLEKRNLANAGYNRAKAEEMKQLARSAGVGDQVKIHEGYEDNN